MSCKHIFILQLPEDKTKNYVGVLDSKYQFSSFRLQIKSQMLTYAVAKQIKQKLLSLDIDSRTQIVLSSSIGKGHPLYIALSIARKMVQFNFSTVAVEKAFKRIASYHTSFRLGREYTLHDYNKLYKKLIANEVSCWLDKDIDRQLQMCSKQEYRIQKFLRTCLYYMCIKQYYLSRGKSRA